MLPSVQIPLLHTVNSRITPCRAEPPELNYCLGCACAALVSMTPVCLRTQLSSSLKATFKAGKRHYFLFIPAGYESTLGFDVANPSICSGVRPLSVRGVVLQQMWVPCLWLLRPSVRTQCEPQGRHDTKASVFMMWL